MATLLKTKGTVERHDHVVSDITLASLIVVVAALFALLATLTGFLEWWEAAAIAGGLAVLAIAILWTVESFKRQTY